MIIKELYVGGFGRLHDLKLKLDSGLNEVKAENGWGKSTLAAFISAMLYGLDDTRSQKLDENPRKKYTPWDTDVFGGYMVFSTDKGDFRCERSFGKKASVNFDTFTLISLETGKESTAYSEKLGQDIFGIDEDGFLRSAYLSERTLSQKNQNPTISAKLSKISLAEADMGGYDAAEKLLDERRKFYIKRGGGGEIRDTESEASLYESKIAAIKEKQGAADSIRKALTEVSLEIEGLKQKADAYRESGKALDEQAKRRLISERYRELLARESELKEAEAGLLSFFGGSEPLADDVKALAEARAEGEAAIGARDALIKKREQTDIEPPKSHQADLNAAIHAIRAKRTVPMAVILSGIVLLAIGCILLAFILPLGIGAAICGVLLTIIGIYIDLSHKKKAIKEAAAIIKDCGATRIPKTKSEIESALAALILTELQAEQMAKKQKSESEAREALIEEYNVKIAELCEKEKGAVLRLGIAPESTASEVSEAFARLAVIKKDRQRATEAALRFKEESGVALESDNTEAPLDTKEKIDYLISHTQGEIIEAERKKARLEGDLRALSEDSERLYEYEDKLAELRERIATYNENLSVISNTSRLLAEAKERLTARYLGSARAAFDKYCEDFGLEGDFTLDTSFNLTKTELGKSRALEVFSRGTRELFALTVRLALTDALFDGDYPPIILDDPFTALDDERIEKAKGIVSSLATTRQVIYFTCCDSRKIHL